MDSRTWLGIMRRHRHVGAVLTRRLEAASKALAAADWSPFDALTMMRLKALARRLERRQYRHVLVAMRDDIVKPVGRAN